MCRVLETLRAATKKFEREKFGERTGGKKSSIGISATNVDGRGTKWNDIIQVHRCDFDDGEVKTLKSNMETWISTTFAILSVKYKPMISLQHMRHLLFSFCEFEVYR